MRGAIVTVAAALLSCAAVPAVAQDSAPNPQVDYSGFLDLSAGLEQVRAGHRLPLAEFLARAQAEGALLLDARSESAFAAGHLAGAVNVPFPDFTADRLAEVIGPDRTRPIYIYCNNNFSDNAAPVVTKRPALALNIPTFINLHGYGYANVWELADVVATTDVPWVRAAVTG